MGEPEAPEDVETSPVMRHVVENRVQAVAERVRLQKLCASGRLKQEPRSPFGHVLGKHHSKRPAKIHFPRPILRLQVWLNHSAFRFLHDIERAEIYGYFAFIEQGGTSLYPSLAQRVTHPEVLRILLSIGPTETMHFQTWQDKAGNATPLTDVDPQTGASVAFVDLTKGQPESLQANLIMPEPMPFLDARKFPICSIIR